MTVFNIPASLFYLKGLILPIPFPWKFYSRFFYLMFCFFILLSYPIFAQNTHSPSNSFLQSKLTHLSIDDGLSQNGAFAIAQDNKGFMWIGTKDGLNKYDGYSFTVFNHNPYDSTTLSSNSVRALYNDSRGILWIITSKGELNFMDSKTEIFHKIPINIQNMSSITEDKEGNIWIGTFRTGLFQVKRKDILTSNYQFTNYKHQPDKPNSIIDNNILSIATDQDGILWIGTSSGLDTLTPNSERFEHYFIEKVPVNKVGN